MSDEAADPLATVTAFQLADSFLPVGTYTASYGLESYEIAAYESLIAMAETVGHDTATFRQILKEEEAFVAALRPHVGDVTKRMVALLPTKVDQSV